MRAKVTVTVEFVRSDDLAFGIRERIERNRSLLRNMLGKKMSDAWKRKEKKEI